MTNSVQRTFRLDSKGRITLGRLAEGVSSFRGTRESDGRIVLVPYVEIPARERWVYENSEVLASLERGIKEAGEGKTAYVGSFAKYAEDD